MYLKDKSNYCIVTTGVHMSNEYMMFNADATRQEQARKEARDAKNPLRLRDLLLPAAFAAATYFAVGENTPAQKLAGLYDEARTGIEYVVGTNFSERSGFGNGRDE